MIMFSFSSIPEPILDEGESIAAKNVHCFKVFGGKAGNGCILCSWMEEAKGQQCGKKKPRDGGFLGMCVMQEKQCGAVVTGACWVVLL